MSIRPRQSLLNPDLQRPSALNSIPRSSSMLWLDKNENLDPTMLAVSAEILASIPPIALATYPEAGDLYRKLSTWIGVDPEALLLTPGSDGAIRLTFETFIDDGDFVLHTNPTFAMYPIYCQMFGASAIAIEYSMVGNEPSLEVLQIVDSIKRHQPKLVCLPNPDSPTGTVISPDDLKKILSVCEEFNCVLLVDEAYHPFYKWSIVPWTKTSKNLIVARTFAKAWGLLAYALVTLLATPKQLPYFIRCDPCMK